MPRRFILSKQTKYVVNSYPNGKERGDVASSNTVKLSMAVEEKRIENHDRKESERVQKKRVGIPMLHGAIPDGLELPEETFEYAIALLQTRSQRIRSTLLSRTRSNALNRKVDPSLPPKTTSKVAIGSYK